MSKNIVICCDGTSNEFGRKNSNVVHLQSALVREPGVQEVFYQPGLGTAGEIDWAPLVGRVFRKMKDIAALGFGYGLLHNVANCYRFLMEHYDAGDRVYVFGFSRGAYTARALCGMIQMFGIFDRGNDVSVDYAIELFKRKKAQKNDEAWEIAGRLKRDLGRPCKPHFVGVWDTVASVGHIWDPLDLPFTHKSKDVLVARHALAIDEKRIMFRPNLWATDGGPKDLKQVWFTGAHSDIGGGLGESNASLAKLSLAWMFREAEAHGLMVNPKRRYRVCGDPPDYPKPDPLGAINPSLKGIWWAIEYAVPRFAFNLRTGKKSVTFGRGSRRIIADGSTLHASVVNRLASKAHNYAPANIPAQYEVEK